MQVIENEIENLTRLQRDYFLKGNTITLTQRKVHLKKLKQLLKAHEQEIADSVYEDFGKSYFEVRQNELGLVYTEISLVLKKLHRWARPQKKLTSLVNLPGKSRVYPIPFGNVLIISPWNYPVQLALIPVISAIAAGNTVILKPSELTPKTSGILGEIINSNFPKELIHVFTGGVELTQEILKRRFDKIFFTGSTKVGKIVMKAAAEHLTPVTLELGGKNPTLVLPDCNLRMTARRIVWGKFHNGGQACVSPDHIYVHEDIMDKFIQAVKTEISRLFAGDPSTSQSFPRIINNAHYDRINGLVDPAKVIEGGSGNPSTLYFEPTILGNVEENDAVMQEEVFGPILPLLSYKNLDELLEKLKKRPSPLALYVFSGNKKLARSIQKNFRSGGGMINDTVVHFVNKSTPFGGIGDSGMGNYHGKAGFECFSHAKSVLSKPTWFELWVKYPPYTKMKLNIIRWVLK